MATTQLRRYEITPGQMDSFLEWFPNIVPVREKYGFTVQFAYADRENNQFVWAVSHDGDFNAAFEEYNVSPERTAAFAGQPQRVDKAHIALVDSAL